MVKVSGGQVDGRRMTDEWRSRRIRTGLRRARYQEEEERVEENERVEEKKRKVEKERKVEGWMMATICIKTDPHKRRGTCYRGCGQMYVDMVRGVTTNQFLRAAIGNLLPPTHEVILRQSGRITTGVSRRRVFGGLLTSWRCS